MAGDFSTLYRLQGDQYVAGCPVVVRAGALLKHEPSKQLIGQQSWNPSRPSPSRMSLSV